MSWNEEEVGVKKWDVLNWDNGEILVIYNEKCLDCDYVGDWLKYIKKSIGILEFKIKRFGYWKE